MKTHNTLSTLVSRMIELDIALKTEKKRYQDAYDVVLEKTR